MRARKKVAELINHQLKDGYMKKCNAHGMWHYGREELKELMDFIYGGKPQVNEEIARSHR